MLPDDRDAGLLWSMLRPLRYLIRKGGELTPERLASDEDSQYGIAKALELVGEAARRLSTPFRDAHPQIPWSQVIGLRHLLVHEYRKTDWSRIWKTITVQVPEFLAQIEPLLPDLPPGEAEADPPWGEPSIS